MFEFSVIKKLYKPFFVLLLIGFLLFNWGEISWIFNHQALWAMLVSVLPKSDAPADIQVPPKPDSLEIPILGVSAPLVFVEEADQVQDALERGVVHWPESNLLGEIGQTFVLGHSAPPNWPKIGYKGVFSRLSELKEGDEILIFTKGKSYIYRVARHIYLERGEEIPANEAGRASLYLITCWPPGQDIRRLAIEAFL